MMARDACECRALSVCVVGSWRGAVHLTIETSAGARRDFVVFWNFFGPDYG